MEKMKVGCRAFGQACRVWLGSQCIVVVCTGYRQNELGVSLP